MWEFQKFRLYIYIYIDNNNNNKCLKGGKSLGKQVVKKNKIK